MEDEELAKEYARHERCAHCSDLAHCQGEDDCYHFTEVRDHFLAGLKARNCISSGTSACTDLCKHCMYVECGDFTCDIDDDATIVGWKPFPCRYPEKRCIKEGTK